MMQPLSISQLYERYNQLRGQLERREITHPQFVNLAHQLKAQDQDGRWWTIDPHTGRYMTYTSAGWTPATPLAAGPSPAVSGPAEPSRPQAQAKPRPQTAPARRPVAAASKKSGGGLRGCLSSPLVVGLLSFGTAGFWLIYSSVRGSYEGYDLMTPLVIGGTPLLMRLLQRPLDKILAPLYRLTRIIPRPLLVGAALAVPFMLGVFFSNRNGTGYGALQRSTILSVMLGYVLTRRPPEVAR